MTSDTLADILTRIRNAMLVKNAIVTIPKTTMTKSLREIFSKEGYIENVLDIIYKSTLYTKTSINILILQLKYTGAQSNSVITNVQVISRPGLRVYVNYNEIPKILGKLGIVILSTSNGLITDHNARFYQMGGEVICSIWLCLSFNKL